jgi:hypothetical protein
MYNFNLYPRFLSKIDNKREFDLFRIYLLEEYIYFRAKNIRELIF